MVRQSAFKGIEQGRDPTDRRRARPRSRRPPRSVPPRPTQTSPRRQVRACAHRPTPKSDSRRHGQVGDVASSAERPTDVPVDGVTDDELAALDALGKEGVWQVGGDELKLTNLDKPLFEPREPDAAADHEARAHPLLRAHRADDAAAPRRPAAQPPALPERRRRARVLAEGHPRDRAEVADPLARDRRRRPERPRGQRPPPRRPRGRAVLARQPGQLRDPRLDRPPARPVAADVRATSTSTRARRRPGRRRSSWPGSTGRRWGTSACAAIPRRPASAASRSGSRSRRKYDFDRDQRVGGASRRARSAPPCRTSISWEWAKEARKGRARLDYTQNASHQDAGRAVLPCGRRPARRSRRRSTWDELDDPDLRPDRWTIRTIVERVAEKGDLFAAAQTDLQELPQV